MFEKIKKEVDILDAISFYTGEETSECGTNTFELENKECPFCDSKDSFKINVVEYQEPTKDEEGKDNNDGESSYFNCFGGCSDSSEPSGGSIIEFVKKLKMVDWKDATKALSEDFNVELPRYSSTGSSPIADVFTAAAGYYNQNLLDDNHKHAELGNRTALTYQGKERGHSSEVLTSMQVGWTTGGLCDYLVSVGFDTGLLLSSGLMSKKTKKDYFPEKLFIYPHFVKGEVSHFTIKDPLKQKKFQLPNSCKLNNHKFYNQDDLSRSTDSLILVEGENDVLSVLEDSWSGGIVGVIGSLSDAQIKQLCTDLADRDVITIFDSDKAGSAYRRKLTRLLGPKASSLVHVVLPEEVNDIDKYLHTNKSHTVESALTQYVESSAVDASPDTSTEDAFTLEGLSILEKNDCYQSVKDTNDGYKIVKPISDFVLHLNFIYLIDNTRERELVIRKRDGSVSKPFVVNSEIKVSGQRFRVKMADIADASFWGNESQLMEMWQLVYGRKETKVVRVPETVGRLEKEAKWIFANCAVDEYGKIIPVDEDRVLWFQGEKQGIRARAVSGRDPFESVKEDVPTMKILKTPEAYEKITEQYIHNIVENVGDIGIAMTMLGWVMANAHSHYLFDDSGEFPFLFLWGVQGKGKSSVVQWLLAPYGMDKFAYTTIAQMRNGAGWDRKAAYYGKLPMCVDEIRSDKETLEHYPRFRSWYNKAPREMGSRDNSRGTVTQKVLANFIFAGQDTFNDDALRSRALPLRMPPDEVRELSRTYAWLNRAMKKNTLTSIGLKWISEAHVEGSESVLEERKALDKRMRDVGGCNPRAAAVWSMFGMFGRRLCHKYYPDYDYNSYLIEAAKADNTARKEGCILERFFSTLFGIILDDRSAITSEHYKLNREEGTVNLWLEELYKIVAEKERRCSAPEERFSDAAIRAQLAEERYYIKKDRVRTGSSRTQKRTVLLNLKDPSTPESLIGMCQVMTVSDNIQE